jgi:hypothetical protein
MRGEHLTRDATLLQMALPVAGTERESFWRGRDHAPDRNFALRFAAKIVKQRGLQSGERAFVYA